MTEPTRLDSSLASRRELFTLALLTGLAIAMFLAVTGLSRLFQAQQESLAERWSTRGAADLKTQRFTTAVSDFRAALRYDRDNYSYQLSLAQALLGMKRSDEASAYLLNLWDRQPENGFVNLELARIAAGKGQTAGALRYYHNAVYAIWPGDQETASRNTRIELIDYLLQIQARGQAQAELIALAANLGENSPEQERMGELFLRAGDSQHALAAFRLAISQNPRDHAALIGAGTAAFQTGMYPTAQSYLEKALQISPDDEQSASELRKTEFVLELDPYRQQISAAEREHAVIKAFAVAGDRLKTCSVNAGAGTAALQNLSQQWTRLKPQISAARLRRDPDLVNTAMTLAINIERESNGTCAPASESDSALLLIANLHEEN